MGDGEGGSAKPPAWLPDGWIVKVRARKSGKVDRYYVSLVSGCTFRSRVEVMRYLNLGKVDDHSPVTTTCPEEEKPCITECSEEDKPCDVEQAKNSPIWLPSGWIVEMRTCQNGGNAGRKCKCYIDPSTGSSFYTKAEVFRYLKNGKNCNSTSKKKKLPDAEPMEKHLCNSTSSQKSINSDSKDDVVTLIETSPDGLPPGWIKEIRCKQNATGVRKDPYYTDPVSGYVFRSKKDALRYIETGEISRHAFKSKTKRSANEMYSTENKSPPPISAKKLKSQGGEGTQVQRSLFEGKVRKSSRKTTKENNELRKDSSSPATKRDLLQCEQSAGPSYEAPSDAIFLKDKQLKAINLTNLHENELPDKPLKVAEEEALDQVIEKLLDSVSKSAPGSSDGKRSDPVSENLQNPLNTEWLEVKPADKIKSQSFEPVHNPAAPPKRQLQFGGTKADMMAKRKPMELVGTAYNVRMEASKEKSQELGVNKKMELEDQNGKLSEPEEKLVRGNLSEPHETSELACGKISGQGIEESKEEGQKGATGIPQPRKSKVKSEKSATITRRASKRLAGLEAEPAADIELSDKSLKRGRPSTQLKPRTPLDDNREVQTETPKPREEPLREGVEAETPKFNKEAALGEHVDVEEGGHNRTSDKDMECKVASPFGDSWPDPCIEFAFKTLTGEIPVLDTTTIQGYLLEQLSSVQIPSPDVPRSSVVGDCPKGQLEPDARTRVNSAVNDVPPGTSGRVKRLCRRRSQEKSQHAGSKTL